MLLQAALNGDVDPGAHAGLPLTLPDLSRDATACVAAGAGAIHLHPRNELGVESLDPEIVNGVVTAVRDACGVPVGVSTGAWIEPDLERRLAQISAWRAPDYASVNLSEPGAEQVAAALHQAGVGIEAGICSVDDAERLARWPLRDHLTRILVEPIDAPAADAVAITQAIHKALDQAGFAAPRLQHGDGSAAWVLVFDAIDRGWDTRIGFEDTLLGPQGETVSENATLVRAAAARATPSTARQD